MAEKSIADFEIVADGKDLFVRVEGGTIAKRGQRGSPLAATWIILAIVHFLWPGTAVAVPWNSGHSSIAGELEPIGLTNR